MGRLVGIDLGTTNSALAIFEAGEPVIITLADGARTMPSVAAITPRGEHIVGRLAKRQATQNPKGTFYSVKRLIGRRPGDPELKPIQEALAFRITRDTETEGVLVVLPDGKTVPPPAVSAVILRSLKDQAEAYIGEPVTDAVITVPAYFKDPQRQATMEAGRIAGLNVLRIINEPTAAALAYSLEKSHTDRTVLVYDLGGGTFDVSVLRIEKSLIKVLATDGDTWLGGDDFDRAVTNHLLAAFEREHGIDLSTDVSALGRFREASEQARIELSSMNSTDVNLPFIYATPAGPINFLCTLTRAQLESLTNRLVQSTREPLEKALDAAGLDPADIDDVLLVGGMTRMPAVQRLVESFFGAAKIRRNINPDEAVALGAAVQGALITQDVRNLVILDKTAHSLGIELIRNGMSVIIDGNTTIPTTRTRDGYSTPEPYLQYVSIDIRQGESDLASENTLIGQFNFGPLEGAKTGHAFLQVKFDIDVNGHLEVEAQEVFPNRPGVPGRKANYTVNHSTTLTEGQLKAAKRWLSDGHRP